MNRLVCCIIVFIPVFMQFFCSKLDNPDSDLLQNQFSQELKEVFELKSFNVEEQHNIGTDLEPVFKTEFKATVIIDVDYYHRNNQISATLPEELRSKTIKGSAISRLVNNLWNTQFSIESNNVLKMKTEGKNIDDIIAVSSEDCNSEQCEIVKRFVKLYNNREIEQLFSLISDSLIIDGDMNKNGFKKEVESDFILNSKMIITLLYQNGETIICDFELFSDFNKLLGIDKIHYDDTEFQINNNLITAIKYAPREKDIVNLRLSFSTFIEWAEIHQNDNLSKLKHDGEYAVKKENAENWISILQKWNNMERGK